MALLNLFWRTGKSSLSRRISSAPHRWLKLIGRSIGNGRKFLLKAQMALLKRAGPSTKLCFTEFRTVRDFLSWLFSRTSMDALLCSLYKRRQRKGFIQLLNREKFPLATLGYTSQRQAQKPQAPNV